jgi:hypothetical protein
MVLLLPCAHNRLFTALAVMPRQVWTGPMMRMAFRDSRDGAYLENRMVHTQSVTLVMCSASRRVDSKHIPSSISSRGLILQPGFLHKAPSSLCFVPFRTSPNGPSCC